MNNGGYQGVTGNDNSYNVVIADSVNETAVLDGFIVMGGNADGSGFYSDSGGGMHIRSGSPIVRNCTFTDNSASAYGGGMFIVYEAPTVTDCTFSGNIAKGNQASGGGMVNYYSSPTVTNCVFSGNKAVATDGWEVSYGGGMYNFFESNPIVMDSEFLNNQADDGGGMANRVDSHPTVTNCTFSENKAEYSGGGMYNEDSGLTVTNCTFSDNIAQGYGGGMYNVSSSPEVTGCTFSGNTADEGGGMANSNSSSSPVVTNCTFSGSSAEWNGGGMFNRNHSRPTVINCTFSGNSAINEGGGIYNSDSSTTTVTNTIFWGTDSTAGQVINDGATLVITYSITEEDGTGNTSAPPRLGLLADNGGGTKTHALLAGSSALNTGRAVGPYTIGGKQVVVPNKDQRGVARPQGSGVDIGAYELSVSPAPGPDPDPIPGPVPQPTPPPGPVVPPVIPPEIPLPDGSVPATPTPLVVTLPPNATPEQKREALLDVLQNGGIPQELVESLLDILLVGDDGRVYITDEGMESLKELLDGLEIPEGAAKAPLAAFRAVLGQQTSSLSAGDATAVVFFDIPESFRGKSAGTLHAVKALTSESAELFDQVFSLEDLRDRCSAVVEVESIPGGSTLKRVLGPDDLITADCLLVLAVKDGGRFDLDGQVNGIVVDPVFLVEGRPRSTPDNPQGGGGGCTAGSTFSPLLLLLLLAPLSLLAAGRRK